MARVMTERPDTTKLFKGSTPFESKGFLRAVAKAKSPEQIAEVEKSYQVQKTALQEASGILGGYTVPVDFNAIAFEALAEYSFLWPRALVIPMTSAETLFPRVNEETAPASLGISPFFGGINFVWGQGGGEGNNIPDASSAAPFKQGMLKAWDLIGQLTISNQLVHDMDPALELFLIQLFGRAAGWHAEYSFFRGTGTALQMPLGILNSAACLSVARAGPGHIAIADVANLAAKLIPLSWTNSIWVCSPSALADIFKISGYQPNTSSMHTERGCAGSLMSRPLFVSEKLPALGSAGDLLFLDPSMYVIGNRQEIVIEASATPLFRTNQTVLRVWLRMDGKPLLNSYVTLADTTSTASAFVQLAA